MTFVSCFFRASALTAGFAALVVSASTPRYDDLDQPPHLYHQRAPQDRFTRLKDDFENGQIALDRSSELAFLTSVLRALDVPVTSQMLVFSTTSLQLSLISPENPRGLYFNEDIYVGYVPGGRIEIVALDPELGGIFYIFDIPKDTSPVRIERSRRCMNCHAGDETGHVPGLVVKSVVPGPGGGSLTAYRLAETGHSIPFDQRFGGWHVTGADGFTNHWGNLTGRLNEGTLTTTPNPPGSRFRWSKFPASTSDILPQLLHEHQAGFVNRVAEASYRARTILHHAAGPLSEAQSKELDEQARIVVRYLLFADEAPLPTGGIAGDSAYKEDFRRHRRAGPGGISLKDFDLRARLFQFRCSYMIYSPIFSALPGPLKQRVYERIDQALNVEQADPEFAYLPAEEKRSIREILRATLDGWPSGW